ncbi:Endochitinase protein [Rutstroemia sp. NJR-2017a WRK4]|nr:Endochitinase protein [Rutstroemia sp. NJR-2017a WRK4]
MNYIFRTTILTAFLCISFHEPVTLAATIPAIPPYLRKTHYPATRVEVTIPDIQASLSDLEVLQRQEEDRTSNIAIKHELEHVLEMIQEVERQRVDMINSFGEESPAVTVPETPVPSAIDEQSEDVETITSKFVYESTSTLENVATITSEALLYPSDGVVDATSTATAATESSSEIAHKFDARSSSNIAVYFAQSPLTSSSSLTAQCSDPNIDIVILAFVVAAKSGGDYPAVNFGAACNFDQTPIMAEKAPGLLRCPELAEQIEKCQGLGKKILLSTGGSTGQIAFASDEDAVVFAKVIWGLFGPLGALDEGLRPFGKSVLDGFDIGIIFAPVLEL